MSSEDMIEMRQALRETASTVLAARTNILRMANLMAHMHTVRAGHKAAKRTTVYEAIAKEQAGRDEETGQRFWLMLQSSVLGLDEDFQVIEGKPGLLEKLGNWTRKNGLSRPEHVISLCDFSGSEMDFELVLKAIFNACLTTPKIEQVVKLLHNTVQVLIQKELAVEEEQMERESDDDEDVGPRTRKKAPAKTKLQLKLEKIEDIAEQQMQIMFQSLKADQLFMVDIQRIENEKIRKRKSPPVATTASVENKRPKTEAAATGLIDVGPASVAATVVKPKVKKETPSAHGLIDVNPTGAAAVVVKPNAKKEPPIDVKPKVKREPPSATQSSVKAEKMEGDSVSPPVFKNGRLTLHPAALDSK